MVLALSHQLELNLTSPPTLPGMQGRGVLNHSGVSWPEGGFREEKSRRDPPGMPGFGFSSLALHEHVGRAGAEFGLRSKCGPDVPGHRL